MVAVGSMVGTAVGVGVAMLQAVMSKARLNPEIYTDGSTDLIIFPRFQTLLCHIFKV
jgi:hypothetical protein